MYGKTLLRCVEIKEAKMLKNPYVKNVFPAGAVTVFGYILLNLAFLLYALIINGIGFFLPADFAKTSSWYMPVMMTMISVGILVSYWFVFRSGLGEIYKAILMTVPTAVVLVMVGISLYRWPPAAISLGGLLSIGVLYYFYRTKQPWLYYYAVNLVAAKLLIMNSLGVEI